MPEKPRPLFIRSDPFETPTFREIDPVPTLFETNIAIAYAISIMDNCFPWKRTYMTVDGKRIPCEVYRFKTGEEEKIIAIADSLIADVNKKGEILKYTPFTYFVRR